ncbi:LOW QUALITY PROTEIN: hypothetical protein SETIT_7G202800v2 [Setaria italica]|uniref:Uncharacterized protein n=1 Tax=Setaria italica TaxID=4555 RepID=A0A368RXV1_SETIT|nr:LOW QUALITY PROTEIN: hypothetical protein SETIT_7G202800v2 [Setaria italica]
MAPSYRLPIGSFARDDALSNSVASASSSSSAMVCAGRCATTSAWRREKSPSGRAVSSRTRAPAPRATPQMASTVENEPGPAEATRRSPAPAGGAVTSPTQCAGRPRCARRMQRARIMRPSRPTPCTNTRPPRAAAAASSETRTEPAGGCDEGAEKTAAIWAQMAPASSACAEAAASLPLIAVTVPYPMLPWTEAPVTVIESNSTWYKSSESSKDEVLGSAFTLCGRTDGRRHKPQLPAGEAWTPASRSTATTHQPRATPSMLAPLPGTQAHSRPASSPRAVLTGHGCLPTSRCRLASPVAVATVASGLATTPWSPTSARTKARPQCRPAESVRSDLAPPLRHIRCLRPPFGRTGSPSHPSGRVHTPPAGRCLRRHLRRRPLPRLCPRPARAHDAAAKMPPTGSRGGRAPPWSLRQAKRAMLADRYNPVLSGGASLVLRSSAALPHSSL